MAVTHSFLFRLFGSGFIFGPVVAQALGCGFIPLRKPDKLPGDLICQTYTKEYGEDEICIQKGLLKPGDRVLLVDDLLATGGTLIAAAKLIQKAGAEPIGAALVIELSFLPGRAEIAKETGVDNIVALLQL